MKTLTKLLTLLVVLLLTLTAYQAISYAHYSLYDYDNYNCSHMSRDLEKYLEFIGFDVKIMVGIYSQSNTGHMWIKVYNVHIDSVTLYPFDPTNNDYDYIKEYESFIDASKEITYLRIRWRSR